MTKAIKQADERIERYLKQMDGGDCSCKAAGVNGGGLEDKLAEKEDELKEKAATLSVAW